jgi:hypothetical protein
MLNATDLETRESFDRCGLRCAGWEYEQAIDVPAIHKALICSAVARQRHIQRQPHQSPIQPSLI